MTPAHDRMSTEAPDRMPLRHSQLWFFLAVGLALRLVVSLFYPLIHHPDEVFQYLEQAHRLVTGDGFLPWEYREGIRSWLAPAALVPLKWLADLVSTDPRVFTRAAFVAMSCFSLSIVWLGYQWTLRHHGVLAAAVVGSLLAFSPPMLLYSPRVLTEVAATNLLFLALSCAPSAAAVPATGPRPIWRQRYFWIGVFLGLTFVVRFNIGGSVALLGIFLCGGKLRERWLPALAGGALLLLALGVLDWATWGYPFQSIIRNFQLNIIEGVAATYGTTSFLEWTLRLGSGLVWFLPLLGGAAALLFLGRRHNTAFLLMLLGVLIPLSFVGHKEVRHFYPAMPPALLVMGVGLARGVEWLRSRAVGLRAASSGSQWRSC